jgi:hypothetical protein
MLRKPSSPALTGTLLCLALLVGLGCLNPQLGAPSFIPGNAGSVQEGVITLRAGEEVRVYFRKPFRSPPRLEIAGFQESWFADKPYGKDNFQFVQVDAVCFCVRNDHAERTQGSWAVVKWRATGEPGDEQAGKDPLIAMVERLNGKVTRDPPAAGFAVSGIDLHRTRATDADLEPLRGRITLRQLNLYGTKVTDNGLANLSGLTRLKTLNLNNTAVTNEGLRHLRGLTGLTELNLLQTGVTDDGLPLLGSLTGLQNLSLGGAGITDRGLQQLKGLRNLSQLILVGTGVTPAAVEELQRALPRVKVQRL